MKQFKLLILALVSVLILGCVSSANRETPGEYVSDSWITTKVLSSLAADKQVKATEVNVETFKGAVQLSGFVSSKEAMNQAVYITRNIQGVTSVQNDMRLR